MKIIIVDDSQENLEAAKEAAKSFPEHEFIFHSSAKKTADDLESADAIISDLFFPDENHRDGSNLDDFLILYRSEMDMYHPVFQEITNTYYRGKTDEATEKFWDAVSILEDGTIRKPVERLIQLFRHRYLWKGDRYALESAKQFESLLENLPPPQFPYGGALMLEAYKLGKACCLVSDIHRHACNYKEAFDAIDAMALLLPLVTSGIITIHQLEYDGQGSLSYIGNDEMYEISKKRGKNPQVWTRAIQNCLGQKK